MGFGELAEHAQRNKLLAGFTRSGIWILASLAPITLLARLCVVALYSAPESDDFCLSYQNLAHGFVKTAWIWYNSVVGRVVPLILIQVPAAISGATGIDYFTSYTITITILTVGFAGSLVFAASRLWPRAGLAQIIFMGTALAATILGGLSSLREMLYWLPGVACYTLPGVITALVLVEFVRTAETETRISPVATYVMAIGGFTAALCNEFTPPWLIGMMLCSLMVRAIFFPANLQIRQHAIIGGATMVGFIILLLAPGNFVRIGLFPLAKDFSRSIHEGLRFFGADLRALVHFPWVRAWLITVVIFTMVAPLPAAGISASKRLLLAVLVPVFCILCSYFAYFVAQYATGSNLAQRAQNETTILLIFGLTIGAALLARALRDLISQWTGPFPAQWSSFALPTIAIALGLIMLSPLDKSITMSQLKSEQNTFHRFWLERIQRHALLSLSTEQDIFVPKLDVFPTTLRGEDLTDDPTRLPNDCIAAFYKKKTVRPEPRKVTAANIVPVLPKLIGDIRAHNSSVKDGIVTPQTLTSLGIDAPSSPGGDQTFSSPWGRVVMTRSGDTSTVDFYSVPQKACPALLFRAAQIEGVVRVAGSSQATDEHAAPVSSDEAERICAKDGTFARVTFVNAVAPQR